MDTLDLTQRRERLEVHIGAGITSFPDADDLRRDTTYVSIDNNNARLDGIIALMMKDAERQYDCRFITRSGTDTGLPDTCADNVRILNVLNSDDARYDREAQTLYGTGLAPFETRILTEARRIVRPHGVIYVGANNTPFQFTLEDVQDIAAELRLAVEVLFYQPPGCLPPSASPDHYHDIAYSHAFQRQRPFPSDSYMVALRKQLADTLHCPPCRTASTS